MYEKCQPHVHHLLLIPHILDRAWLEPSMSHLQPYVAA